MASKDGRLKVVGIGGTLRENSTSLGALRRALEASERAGAEVELLDLNELRLPMYEPRKPLAEYGDDVRRLIGAMRGADALLISVLGDTGERTVVGGRALDYVQFLGKEEPPYFGGKVVGLISTAGGEQAATNANAAMVHTVHALRGSVAPLMVGVNQGVAAHRRRGIHHGRQLRPKARQARRASRRARREDRNGRAFA